MCIRDRYKYSHSATVKSVIVGRVHRAFKWRFTQCGSMYCGEVLCEMCIRDRYEVKEVFVLMLLRKSNLFHHVLFAYSRTFQKKILLKKAPEVINQIIR